MLVTKYPCSSHSVCFMKISSKVMAKIKQLCLGIQAFQLDIKWCSIRALFNMHGVLLNEEKKRGYSPVILIIILVDDASKLNILIEVVRRIYIYPK